MLSRSELDDAARTAALAKLARRGVMLDAAAFHARATVARHPSGGVIVTVREDA